MGTEKELKALLAPVLERFPGWRYTRGWLFSMPVGYYLRGCVFKQAFYDRLGYELMHCVYPMHSAPQKAHINWSRSCAVPGTTHHRWKVDHPNFAESLVKLMEAVIVPKVGHIVTGAQFLEYLEMHQFTLGWPEYAKALALIHMGELAAAQAVLVPMAQEIRERFLRLQAPNTWGANLLTLLQLIEENPAAIPPHCEDVARRSVAATKLEKYWTPTPFVYGGGLEMPSRDNG